MFDQTKALPRGGAAPHRKLQRSQIKPRRTERVHDRGAAAPGETLRSLGQARPRRALSRFPINSPVKHGGLSLEFIPSRTKLLWSSYSRAEVHNMRDPALAGILSLLIPGVGQ